MNATLPIQNMLANFWAKNDNSIWLASSLRILRNLKTHLFPQKLSSEYLSDLTQMLVHPLKHCPEFKKGTLFLFKDLNPKDKQFLFEYYLTHNNYQSYQHGEGLFLDPSFRFHILINTSDHLAIHFIDPTNHLEQTWNKFLQIENTLCHEIEFAFSPKFGFLTANSHNCGTGLHVDLFLHLPALRYQNRLKEELQKISSKSLSIRSLHGHSDHFLGDIVVLTNVQTIGASEEQILKIMHNLALNLILAEKKARTENQIELKNFVSKAFGTLKHAFQLEIEETLNHLSLCKLGVELGWIRNVEIHQINEMIFSIQKEVLKSFFKDSPNIGQFRAEYIKKYFDSATL